MPHRLQFASRVKQRWEWAWGLGFCLPAVLIDPSNDVIDRAQRPRRSFWWLFPHWFLASARHWPASCL